MGAMGLIRIDTLGEEKNPASSPEPKSHARKSQSPESQSPESQKTAPLNSKGCGTLSYFWRTGYTVTSKSVGHPPQTESFALAAQAGAPPLLGPRPVQQTDGVFAVVAGAGTKLTQNHVLGLSSRRSIPFVNRPQVLAYPFVPQPILPQLSLLVGLHLKWRDVAPSVTFAMGRQWRATNGLA